MVEVINIKKPGLMTWPTITTLASTTSVRKLITTPKLHSSGIKA